MNTKFLIILAITFTIVFNKAIMASGDKSGVINYYDSNLAIE